MKLKDIKLGVKDEFRIDPRRIVVDPNHNPRQFNSPENIQRVADLKESIREKGVLTALWVRIDQENETVVLVAGETRLRACMSLIADGVDIVSVPVKTMDGTNNEQERLVLAMTENNVKTFSKIEFGIGCKRFRAWGWLDEQISKQLGVAARYVREAIELAESPEEVKAMVGAGQVSEAVAIQQVRKSGTGAVKALREKVATSGGKKIARSKAEAKNPYRDIVVKIAKEVKGDVTGEELDNDFITVSFGLIRKCIALAK